MMKTRCSSFLAPLSHTTCGVVTTALADMGQDELRLMLSTSHDLAFVEESKPLYDNIISFAPTTEGM